MRCCIVWMSVQRSSLRCCSSSSSVSPSQVQTLFRSEFSCCHCCWFCFVRISLLRSWACRSSQRSITPVYDMIDERWIHQSCMQAQQHLHISTFSFHKHSFKYMVMYGTCKQDRLWRSITWCLGLWATGISQSRHSVFLFLQLKAHPLHCVNTATTLTQQPHLQNRFILS